MTTPENALHGAEGRAFRLVSYNLRRGHGLFRLYRPRRVLAALREIGADAVALQEVDSGLFCDGQNQLEWLARELGMVAAPGLCRPARSGGRYGNALLLRRPPLSVRCHDLRVTGREPRGALEAVIDLGGPLLTLIVTHLGLWLWERREQARMLAEIVRAIDGPLVLAGDFNEWRRHPRPDALDEIFSADADSNGGGPAASSPLTPATYPALWPRFCLDRIRSRPASLIVSLTVPRTRSSRLASDHLPLVAELEMKQGRERS